MGRAKTTVKRRGKAATLPTKPAISQPCDKYDGRDTMGRVSEHQVSITAKGIPDATILHWPKS